jgi:hypothetical protein
LPSAAVCALWIKPRARSVYFSIFIQLSWSRPLPGPEGTNTTAEASFDETPVQRRCSITTKI